MGVQVARLIDQRVAEVLESDAVKESLQTRLDAERKVRLAGFQSLASSALLERKLSNKCKVAGSCSEPPVKHSAAVAAGAARLRAQGDTTNCSKCVQAQMVLDECKCFASASGNHAHAIDRAE